ncbi:Protein TIC 20 [Seminavis robusta]|uniref:Protein TIC 20 n=1 Tax=Seminavis robusta TaxID=568900 RepID=A0A9N8ELH8_9STRA|nr:Protein TIC 20 [Seminavis robusta]|eukprot:Sro1401_g269400.1 Protein TIC 20 (238) ;mRNA; f:3139-3852
MKLLQIHLLRSLFAIALLLLLLDCCEGFVKSIRARTIRPNLSCQDAASTTSISPSWSGTTTRRRTRSISNTGGLSMMNNNNQAEIQGSDRIVSCIPYLLPLMDGDRYGRFLFTLLPPLGMADTLLLGPFKFIYFSIPFAQFLAFIGLSFLSRNPEIPRPIRFNMQQALVLDILLIFPSLLGRLPFAMPRVLVESGSNFIFYALVACVGYALVSNLSGKLPNQIPVVSEASELQIGPF